jgi:hypothetical protein
MNQSFFTAAAPAALDAGRKLTVRRVSSDMIADLRTKCAPGSKPREADDALTRALVARVLAAAKQGTTAAAADVIEGLHGDDDVVLFRMGSSFVGYVLDKGSEADATRTAIDPLRGSRAGLYR